MSIFSFFSPPSISILVLYNLDCTLAELFNGCIKKFNITRKRLSPDGSFTDESKMLSINIKPGWKKGTKVTFPSEGDEVVGGIPADIIFTIQEKPETDASSPTAAYERVGNDLIYTYKITLADALSDCSLQIPTLDKRILSIACPEVVSPFYEKRVLGLFTFYELL
jgi:hypothetical protein